MVKLRGCIIVIILLLNVLVLTAAAPESEHDCLYYFYGEGCEDCVNTNTYLNQLQKKYPELQVQRFEVYYNVTHFTQLEEYLTAYGVSEDARGVPAVFASETYFIGKGPITSLLEPRIKDNTDASCPSLEKNEVVGVVGKRSPYNVLQTLTFSTVTGAGLRNFFSLVGIALFVILLVIASGFPERSELRRKSLVFLGGIFLAYFLAGLGLFNWFFTPLKTNIFLKIIGLLSIVFFFILIKDFSLPLKKSLQRYTDKQWVSQLNQVVLSYPGVFLLGVLVSLFTLGQTTEMLKVLRDLFAVNIGQTVIVPVLLYYALVLVLPLIIFILLLHFILHKFQQYAEKRAPQDTHHAELWNRHLFKVLHFIFGVVILILGIVLLVR